MGTKIRRFSQGNEYKTSHVKEKFLSCRNVEKGLFLVILSLIGLFRYYATCIY